MKNPKKNPLGFIIENYSDLIEHVYGNLHDITRCFTNYSNYQQLNDRPTTGDGHETMIASTNW